MSGVTTVVWPSVIKDIFDTDEMSVACVVIVDTISDVWLYGVFSDDILQSSSVTA